MYGNVQGRGLEDTRKCAERLFNRPEKEKNIFGHLFRYWEGVWFGHFSPASCI